MQPPLSEPWSCLPLSQQPLGRWQGDGWYLQPGRTAPPKAHTHTVIQSHSLSLVLTHTIHHTNWANKSTPTHRLSFLLFSSLPLLVFSYPLTHTISHTHTHTHTHKHTLTARMSICLIRLSLCCLWQQNQYPTYQGEWKPHKWKQWKCFEGKLLDSFIVCLHGIKHFILK